MRELAVHPVSPSFRGLALAALVILPLLAAPAAAQHGGGGAAGGGSGGAPVGHGAAQAGGAGAKAAPTGPTEKDLLADFDKAWKSPGAKERAAAITALSDLSRNLPDKGASKLMAKTLARGFDEASLEVRSASVAALGYGRDVETVIASFKGFLDGQLKEIDKRITRPDEESKSYVNNGASLLGNACTALANYRDDRSVEILSALLRNLKPNTEGANLATRVVGPMATALLSLGSHDAVEAAVKQTQTFVGDWQEPAAKALHAALAEFATKAGAAPPDYTANYSVSWNQWFQKNGDKLPKKVGKLKEPPTTPPASGTGKGAMHAAKNGGPERP